MIAPLHRSTKNSDYCR